MQTSEARREAARASVLSRPAGILVLDRPPAPVRPRFLAYVWSRERTDHSEMRGNGDESRPAPRALMVGPKGSMPNGDWSFAV